MSVSVMLSKHLLNLNLSKDCLACVRFTDIRY